jgi:hypothetical protein
MDVHFLRQNFARALNVYFHAEKEVMNNDCDRMMMMMMMIMIMIIIMMIIIITEDDYDDADD